MAALVLALAIPFVASTLKAFDVDWTPTGDEALITMRVREVFSAHPPLIGQPSTADQYSGVDPPHHPGPIQFYLLAPVVALLGSDVGMLVGVAAINLLAVLVVPWVAFRRGGPALGIWAAVVVSTIAWAQGLAVLTDNISSNAGGIPLLALTALAWGVADRDIRLVPAAAFAFAYVAQQHLAIVGVALGIGSWAAVGIVVAVVIWWRTRSEAVDTDTEPESEPAGEDGPWPWVIGGFVVSLLAWLPVLADQFFGQGNLSRMAGFAGSGERESLGFGSGLTQALRALGLPPVLFRTDLTGAHMIADLSIVGVVSGLLVAAALVATVVWRRRSCRAHATLAATTLVLAAVGAFNGASVPDSLESLRINFYRWMFVVSVGVCLSLGWAVARLVSERGVTVPERGRPPLAVAAVVTVLATSVLAVRSGEPQRRRDQAVFVDVHDLRAAASAAVEGKKKVLVLTPGTGAYLSLGPAVVLGLVEDGHDVRVSPSVEEGYRSHLVLAEGEEVDVVLIVQSAKTPDALLTVGDDVVTYGLNDAQEETLGLLAEAVGSGGVVRAEDFDRIVAEQYGDAPGVAEYVEAALVAFEAGDAALIRSPIIGDLIARGAITLPAVDDDMIEAVRELHVRSIWGDQYVTMRVLAPADAAADPAIAYPR